VLLLSLDSEIHAPEYQLRVDWINIYRTCVCPQANGGGHVATCSSLSFMYVADSVMKAAIFSNNECKKETGRVLWTMLSNQQTFDPFSHQQAIRPCLLNFVLLLWTNATIYLFYYNYNFNYASQAVLVDEVHYTNYRLCTSIIVSLDLWSCTDYNKHTNSSLDSNVHSSPILNHKQVVLESI
jgi:hypothetical protein